MISIERVSNGFVVRIEENDEDITMVCQKEFNSMNVSLGAVCKLLIDRWQDETEAVGIKLDVAP
jgi:hypothetical protein